MESTYYLNSNELNEDFIKAIKTLFKNRKIAITVSVEEDETEYLLKSETNKKRLLRAVDNVKKGKNLVSVDINKRICMRQVIFEYEALEDLQYWTKSDLKMLKKIIELLAAIEKNPFDGIGKPEALKHELKGYWSRRIDEEHRLVYKISENAITIIACRFHY